MKRIIRLIGRSLSIIYPASVRRGFYKIWNHFYSGFILNGLSSFPNTSIVVYPFVMKGQKYISIGENTSIDKYGTITASKRTEKEPELRIGNDCSIGAFCHITCINKIIINDNVLFGKGVTVTDNSHGHNKPDEIDIAPCRRDIYSKGEVIIEENVWVGDKVTILPGVTIGKGAVIGANSVVTKDVPSFCVVAGNPAKILKTIK